MGSRSCFLVVSSGREGWAGDGPWPSISAPRTALLAPSSFLTCWRGDQWVGVACAITRMLTAPAALLPLSVRCHVQSDDRRHYVKRRHRAT